MLWRGLLQVHVILGCAIQASQFLMKKSWSIDSTLIKITLKWSRSCALLLVVGVHMDPAWENTLSWTNFILKCESLLKSKKKKKKSKHSKDMKIRCSVPKWQPKNHLKFRTINFPRRKWENYFPDVHKIWVINKECKYNYMDEIKLLLLFIC